MICVEPETHHTSLGNRIGEQDEEDTQHSADLNGEAAWLALRPEGRTNHHMKHLFICLNSILYTSLAKSRNGGESVLCDGEAHYVQTY